MNTIFFRPVLASNGGTVTGFGQLTKRIPAMILAMKDDADVDITYSPLVVATASQNPDWYSLAQLYDNGGTPCPGNAAQLMNGVWRGSAVYKISDTVAPGKAWCDVGLDVWDQAIQRGGGSAPSRVTVQAAPPAPPPPPTENRVAIYQGGVPVGSVAFSGVPDLSVILVDPAHPKGVMLYPGS